LRLTRVMSHAHAQAPSIRAIPFDHTWPSGLATELLSDQQRRHLADIATVRFVPPRTVLFREGDAADSVFIVSRGVMKAYRELRNGKRRVVAFLFPSDVLGLAEGGRYVNNAQALTPAALYSIRMDALKESFRQDFALQFHFLCKVTHELRESQRQTIGVARRDASGKLATFLEMLQRNASQRGDAASASIWLPMSRADIASYLGLTQETLSRAAARLKRLGIVAFPDRRHVLITDRNQLHALADPL
jgi:CRP/FNR family transcriptional regulator